MKLSPILITVTVFILSCSTAEAQKYEQESRIEADRLPSAVLSYLDQHYPGRAKVRHYEEYSKRDTGAALQRFYESKFDADGFRYSVKFDSSGTLYDIERLVVFRRLPPTIRQQIKEDLSRYFRKHRVKKIQEQLDETGEVLGYELVVRGKHDQDIGYFELQYDEAARRISAISIQDALNPFFFF